MTLLSDTPENIVFALMPDGQRLIRADNSGQVAIQDCDVPQNSFPLESTAEPVLEIAVAGSGRYAAGITAAGEIFVWDLKTGKRMPLGEISAANAGAIDQTHTLLSIFSHAEHLHWVFAPQDSSSPSAPAALKLTKTVRESPSAVAFATVAKMDGTQTWPVHAVVQHSAASSAPADSVVAEPEASAPAEGANVDKAVGDERPAAPVRTDAKPRKALPETLNLVAAPGAAPDVEQPDEPRPQTTAKPAPDNGNTSTGKTATKRKPRSRSTRTRRRKKNVVDEVTAALTRAQSTDELQTEFNMLDQVVSEPAGADQTKTTGAPVPPAVKPASTTPAEEVRLEVVHAWKAHIDWVGGLEWMPSSGHLLSIGDDGKAKIWDASLPKTLYTCSVSRTGFRAFATTRAGQTIWLVPEEGLIIRWELGGEKTRLPDSQGTHALSVTADEEYLIMAGEGGDIRVWEIETGNEIRSWKAHDRIVNHIEISADMQLLVTVANDNYVKLWSMSRGQQLARLEGHEDWIMAAALMQDEKTLVTAGDDQLVIVWNLLLREATFRLHGHSAWVRALTPLPPDRVASASYDGQINVWSTVTGARLGTVSLPHGIRALSTAENGRLLFAGGAEGFIHQIEVHT